MDDEYAKRASISLSILLVISGLSGFVVLPLNVAHAGTATLTLSAASATVGSGLTITGVGFTNGGTIQITSAVGSTTVDWLAPNGCATNHGGDSGTDSLVVSGCLTTTGRGTFETTPTVPPMPGGAHRITVTDGTNSATATFTVASKVGQSLSSSKQKGFPGTVITDAFSASGFGASETVSLASVAFAAGSSISCNTDIFGSCSLSPGTFTVGDTTAGTKTLTATGLSTALTATSTFTIKPYVTFFASQSGGAVLSFPGKSPTSLFVEGHGFPSGTIGVNTITVSGVSTSESAFAIDSSGRFGVGAGAHIVVNPNTDVPPGAVSVVIGGTTFKYANGNINQATGTTPILGGVLISTSSSGSPVLSFDATTHTFGDTPAVWGYGFTPGAGEDAVLFGLTTNLPGVTLGTTAGTVQSFDDANGAVFLVTTAGTLTDEPAGSYTITANDADSDLALSPFSYTTTPSISASFDASTLSGSTVGIDYKSGGNTVNLHMFAATVPATVTAGGVTIFSGTTSSLGAVAAGLLNIVGLPAGQGPDLSSGTYTMTATDSANGATDTFVEFPLADFSGTGTALSITDGTAGTIATVRTSSDFGVHGLRPNTAYSLNWGSIGATGAQSLGTFTSTATGGIPTPGVQFTVPADRVGFHVVTLVQGTIDALYGGVLADTPSSAGPLSQYGDLIFSLEATINIAPSVDDVGQNVTLTGSGLAASTAYVTTISQTSGGSGAVGQFFSTFTADSSGNIPSGTSLKVPQLVTGPAGGGGCGLSTYFEQDTKYYVHLSTASQFPGHEDAQGVFVLGASENLNMTAPPMGHPVLLSASGLGDTCTYDIVFNYGVNAQGDSFTGQVVASFVSNNVGAGGAVFTSPAPPGSYVIQLVRVNGPPLGVLSVPATITVTGTGSRVCTDTNCFTAGTSSQQTIGKFPAVVVPYTNNAKGAVTGIAYAVVHNSQGQTLRYTTATLTLSAGQTADAYLVLPGLARGNYTVTYFVTDTGGVAISTSGSTTVTL